MRKFLWLAVFGLFLSAGCTGNPEAATPEHLVYGIPQESDLQLNRRGFSLGYSTQYRQAVWISYLLCAEDLSGKKVKRNNRFLADPAIEFRPVLPSDYRKTGYDRGHLAPAADMAYSIETMEHSFFMSNITPQIPGCNRGIWKRLESQVRIWAEKEEKLCIVTGPIFSKPDSAPQTLGQTDIPIPTAFYKVILDLTPPMKMIGFIIPNQTTRKELKSFAVTVNEVEAITNLDFFSNLPDAQEEELESQTYLELWHIVPNN